MICYLRYTIAALGVVLLAGCTTMGGGPGRTQTSSSSARESNLASRASSVLRQQMKQPDNKRIPHDLVADAKCIAVFPRVIQAGFIVGGHHGVGLVSCRQAHSGWSKAAPAVYSLNGGSVGLQAGAQTSSVILLFETHGSVKSLLSNHLKLGSQIGVTTGPVGLNANISTAPSPIVGYVASKAGLFAGVNLNGSKLSYDQTANARIYTQAVSSPRAILLHANQIPTSMQSFNQTLRNYTSGS